MPKKADRSDKDMDDLSAIDQIILKEEVKTIPLV